MNGRDAASEHDTARACRARIAISPMCTRSLRRDSASEVAEVEARVGRVGLAAALLSPRVQHDAEVRAVDKTITVHVSAAGEAVAAEWRVVGHARGINPLPARRPTPSLPAHPLVEHCAAPGDDTPDCTRDGRGGAGLGFH